MYLRRQANGTIDYVPEDRPARDLVPTCNVRKVDPPVRRGFVNSMSPRARANALIRGYVESLVGKHKDKESPDPAKSFLKFWRNIDADGNPAGVDLAMEQSAKGGVRIFFCIHGVGQVVWLPTLTTAANDHTRHIMREISNSVEIIRERKPNPEAPKRRFVPPKVETVLVKGRR